MIKELIQYTLLLAGFILVLWGWLVVSLGELVTVGGQP